MRKQTALVCCLAAILAAGCTSTDEDGIELIFAAGNDPSGATESLIEEYNATHPRVTVRFQPMPANTDTQHDAYVTYLSARDSKIDLYSLDVIWTAEFARAGWIEPLPEGFVDLDEFLGGPIGSVTYEGEIHAVPWFTDAGVLYYRRDLLEEAGLRVPETWGEFYRACRTITSGRDMEGFVWQGARYEGLVCDFLEFLWGVGGSLSVEAVLETPEEATRGVKRALELMLGFLDDGVSPESVLTYKEEDSRRLFTESQAVFLRNWPYAWSMAEGEESKIKGLAGIAPLPHADGETSYSTIGGWNVAVSSYSRHPDEAREFLLFITGEKSLKERAIRGGYLPTRKSTYEDPDVLKANPHFASFFEVFKNTRNRPRSPHYPRISDVIQDNVHRVLTREIEIDAGAEAIVSRLAEIMGE